MNKNYLGFWLILAVGLVVVIVYSCLDNISIFGIEIKDSGIAERLTRAPQPDKTQLLTQNKPAADSAAREQEKPKLDTASQSILIIGDSMLEGLNPRLGAYAKKNGHHLNSVIWYSSTTKYFGECDTLKTFIKKFNPSFIFLSLGGNELFVRDIIEQRDKYVKKILADIGNIPYVWIGPPNWKKDTGINELIRRNVPAGNFFLSDGMHFERQKDGAHPTHESAALWMDSIARWMPLHGAHPIRLERPEVDSDRPDQVVMLKPLQ